MGSGFCSPAAGFVIFVVASFMLRSSVAIANIGGGLEFLKRFDRADDGAVLVVNGNGVNADGNFISGFGMQETDGPSTGCHVFMARATGQSSLQKSQPG